MMATTATRTPWPMPAGPTAPWPAVATAVVDTGEACDDGNTNDYDGCSIQCGLSASYRRPAVGELVITEMMVNPAAAPGVDGEWFELTSTASVTLNAGGCLARDLGTGQCRVRRSWQAAFWFSQAPR